MKNVFVLATLAVATLLGGCDVSSTIETGYNYASSPYGSSSSSYKIIGCRILGAI